MKEKASVRTLSQAEMTLFAALLLLFLCSAPVFYFMIRSFRAQVGEYNPWSPTANWIYVGVRAVWLVLALVICNLVRKKKLAALDDCGPLRKTALTAALAALIVCAFLDAVWILDKAYYVLSDMMGFRSWSLFPAVLWEQLFNGDLGWMLLIGSIILLLPGMERKKTALCQFCVVAVMVFVRFML